MLHGAPQRLIQTRFDIHSPSVTLQHPAPTQVVLQVVLRHTMEAHHPLCQAMVIPVHVYRSSYHHLLTIPGVGPLIAAALVSEVDATQFSSGSELSAWCGLEPLTKPFNKAQADNGTSQRQQGKMDIQPSLETNS